MKSRFRRMVHSSLWQVALAFGFMTRRPLVNSRYSLGIRLGSIQLRFRLMVQRSLQGGMVALQGGMVTRSSCGMWQRDKSSPRLRDIGGGSLQLRFHLMVAPSL